MQRAGHIPAAHGCRTSRTYVVVLPCIPRRHYRLWPHNTGAYRPFGARVAAYSGGRSKLKPQKCHLMRKTVRFLGHVLSENGISTDKEKIRAVKEWPTPCCPSEVRQFLGLASYYRRFIKNFSMVSTPLNALLRKGSHWKWTADCQTAFDQLWSIKEFQPYLYAHQFDVRTDHSCLRWLRNFKEPEGQRAPPARQGMAELMRCRANVARSVESPSLLPRRYLLRPWKKWHPQDACQFLTSKYGCYRPHAVGATELARLIPVARHCQTSSDPDLRSLWRDGRGVFRVDEDGLLRRRQASSDRADDQLLVPKELRNAVLAAMHNTTFGGHFASRRTLGLPHVCRAKRTDTEIQGAPTDARSILCVPNTGHGLFGPLGRDSYPKVTVTFWSFAVTSKSGPRRIQRAPKRPRNMPTRSFESALIREVCKIFDVEKSRSSPYHPQANGLVERTNRTLLNTLAKLCHESKDRSWDQLLPLVTVAYNSAVHETTGQSLFCMLFGKQICLSLNATLDVPPGTAHNAEDYIVQLRENLQNVHSTAFDRSRHEQQHNKEIADRKATANLFETD
ncbi:Retrovirus-related Pol polyprotein from transposon 17.6 [Trichinella sp. T9]|nr:Retrovirus-related Pol polyprotein from transposon 17.6 [Trichinella sp. T9]